jgi:hypothetical protein
MMTMKRKTCIFVITVIIATSLLGNAAYALSTHHTIHLTLRVVGSVALDLEDSWLNENLREPRAEAFSELKESGVHVDRIRKDDGTIWLFTKTE